MKTVLHITRSWIHSTKKSKVRYGLVDRLMADPSAVLLSGKSMLGFQSMSFTCRHVGGNLF